MKNVCVTAISGDVGNSILKCLSEENCRLIGCDINEYPAGLDRVSAFEQVPIAIDSNYLSAVKKLCLKHKITHFFPTNESEIKVLTKNRDMLEKIGVMLIINSDRLIEDCMDKYRCMQQLEKSGICVPSTYLPEEFIEDGKEYIAKLRSSSGSRFLKFFRTKHEMKNLLQNKQEDFIIQHYIPSGETEYTMGVFSDGKEVRSITFHRKLHNGYTKQISLINDERFHKIACTAARLWNLHGCINIQLREHEGNLYVFEINPRVSGTAYFRHQLNFQDVVWWLRYFDKEYIPLYNSTYQKAIGVREMNEKILCKE